MIYKNMNLLSWNARCDLRCAACKQQTTARFKNHDHTKEFLSFSTLLWPANENYFLLHDDDWVDATTTTRATHSRRDKCHFTLLLHANAVGRLLNDTYFSFGGGGRPAGLLGGVFSFSPTANGASGGGSWQTLSSITLSFSCKLPYTM